MRVWQTQSQNRIRRHVSKQSLTLVEVSKSQLMFEMLENAVVVLVQGTPHSWKSPTLDPAKEPQNHHFQPSSETCLLRPVLSCA